jgi:AraC-like DNA-binding protein
MQAKLYTPKNKLLSGYIDYFLFLENQDIEGYYKTFPNTNICLALYKNNNVHWDRQNNLCTVSGQHPGITTKLFGFHKQPFEVRYKGHVDQICILFTQKGLSHFTAIPVHTIDMQDDPFYEIFGSVSISLYEKLFTSVHHEEKIDTLENFLVNHFQPLVPSKVMYTHILQRISSSEFDEQHVIHYFSTQLGISPSTLYRNFIQLFGQSPKEIHQVMRFRKSLKTIMNGKHTLTEAAYLNHFTDQSHFNKDMKKMTGQSPKKLVHTLSAVEGTLIWSHS